MKKWLEKADVLKGWDIREKKLETLAGIKDDDLEILKNNEVHLLIMDVMMPKLDGIRATLKIRENSSIPIIILSAKTEDSDKILGLNIGADDYVEKPFNPLELVHYKKRHKQDFRE